MSIMSEMSQIYKISEMPKNIEDLLKTNFQYETLENIKMIYYFLFGGYDYKNGSYNGPVCKIEDDKLINITKNDIAERLDVLLIFYQNVIPVSNDSIDLLNKLVNVFGRERGDYQKAYNLIELEYKKIEYTIKNISYNSESINLMFLSRSITYLTQHLIQILNVMEVYKQLIENNKLYPIVSKEKEEPVLYPFPNLTY